MFVQPKYAKLLNTAAVREAMGEPEPSKGVAGHIADGQSKISLSPSTKVEKI